MIDVSISEILESDRQIFALSVSIFCVFILVPIVLYYFCRFYNLRHDIIIAKRHWKIIALQIFCTILFLLIERPLAILFMNNMIKDTEYIYFTDRFLYVLSLHIDLYLIVLRFWTVHYDINFNNAQNIAYWHGLIKHDNDKKNNNDKELSLKNHTNFYLNYHSKFGNLTYLKRIAIIIISFTITISYGSFAISYYLYGRPFCDTIFFVVDAFILFVPSMTLIIIIWCRTPTFHDVFGIKKEMKFIFAITIFGFIFYITWVSLSSMMWIESYFIPNVNVAISCLLYFAVNILPVMWLFHFSKETLPLCACNDSKKDTNKARARIRTVSSPSPQHKLPLSVILSSPIGYDHTLTVGFSLSLVSPSIFIPYFHVLPLSMHSYLKYILHDRFESFMAHLTKEFSAENLVAVIEMIQFVDYYYDKTEKEIEDLEKEYNHQYKPMKVKCSFIGGELDIHKMRDYINAKNKGKNQDGDTGINEEQLPGNEDVTIDMTRMRANTDRMKELIAPAMRSSYSDGDHKLKRLHRAAMDIARSECVRENINGYQGIILPPSIPQSTIIYTKENCIKHKIILLCDKYIITDAELELNISAGCKDNILSKKNKIIELDVEECKSIFNQCLTEIYDLMNGSLTRFRVTPVQ